MAASAAERAAAYRGRHRELLGKVSQLVEGSGPSSPVTSRPASPAPAPTESAGVTSRVTTFATKPIETWGKEPGRWMGEVPEAVRGAGPAAAPRVADQSTVLAFVGGMTWLVRSALEETLAEREEVPMVGGAAGAAARQKIVEVYAAECVRFAEKHLAWVHVPYQNEITVLGGAAVSIAVLYPKWTGKAAPTESPTQKVADAAAAAKSGAVDEVTDAELVDDQVDVAGVIGKYEPWQGVR